MPTQSSHVARRALWLIALATACGTGVSPSPTPSPSPNPSNSPRNTPAGPTPLVQGAWPLRTREHLDLWLHSYALLTNDTTLVPYFKRGYRDQMMALRRERGVSTQLDANRGVLAQRFATNPELATSGQFIPLYFDSWDQLRQAIDLLIRSDGNPRSASDPTARMYVAVLASVFRSPADREWLRLFAEGVDDESRRFYHDYWVGEARHYTRVFPHVDSLWQRQWRPAIQRYLNNTQQQNGELYLSLPLDGEGRTIKGGKQENAVAVAMPAALDQSETALFVFVHEIAGSVASGALQDNTTPAEQRSGAASRYEQAATVRAGALLLERTMPNIVPGYMRYYLQSAGRPAPNDPRAAFAAAFTVPSTVLDAMTRQMDVILGGI
ncbi:MAG TPA: hypothetical protein VGG84_08780 [Gemmatimonadaceae bacterium]